MPSAGAIDLSLVIPVYNEEANLRPLSEEIHAALKGAGIDYEVLFIDDGSSDGSFACLRELAAEDDQVVAVRFRRNYGQTAAFAAGFDHARGRIIVTLDADRQNDPADIPRLVEELEKGYDVVNGWRENRQDDCERLTRDIRRCGQKDGRCDQARVAELRGHRLVVMAAVAGEAEIRMRAVRKDIGRKVEALVADHGGGRRLVGKAHEQQRDRAQDPDKSAHEVTSLPGVSPTSL